MQACDDLKFRKNIEVLRDRQRERERERERERDYVRMEYFNGLKQTGSA